MLLFCGLCQTLSSLYTAFIGLQREKAQRCRSGGLPRIVDSLTVQNRIRNNLVQPLAGVRTKRGNLPSGHFIRYCVSV